MELFHIMLIALAAFIIFAFVYYMVKMKDRGEEIRVDYSEIIGGKIVTYNETFKGYVNVRKNMLQVPDLGLERPAPPASAFNPTKKGMKKVYLLRFDNERYGYRLIGIKNEVMTYKRDIDGNMIKDSSGNPIIIKLNWAICDEVYEPDDRFWVRETYKKIDELHKTNESLLTKWLPLASLLIVSMAIIIMLNMSSKELAKDKAAIMEKAQKAEEDAKRTTDNLNAIMEKLQGKETYVGNAQQTPIPAPPTTRN